MKRFACRAVVEKRIPVTYTQQVPRVVVMRVPIEPCGCCGETAAVALPIPAAVVTPGTVAVPGIPTAPAPPASGRGESRVKPPAKEPAPRDGEETDPPKLGPQEGDVGPVDEEAGDKRSAIDRDET